MILDLGQISIDPKIQSVQITLLFLRREIETGISVFQQLLTVERAIVAIRIGPNMEPQERKRIGRMIRIAEFHLCVHRFFSGVEFYVQMITEGLFPVRLAPGGQYDQ